MGCGPSSLAVVELNRSLKTCPGTQLLHDKLQSSPWLLSSAPTLLSSTGGTPLHTACERKQIEVVQRMLSFLSCANLAVVREALQPYCRRYARTLPGSVAEGVRLAVNMINCKGQTPLVCACAAGCPELVKLLLAQGADPWVADRCGARTALHYAAMSGSGPCVEALMQNIPVSQLARRGVRYIDVRSLCGLSALHYAIFFDHLSAIEELLRHDPNLHATTTSHSYDIFVTCDAMSTPLHFAAIRGSVAVVRALLQALVRHATSPSRDPRLRADAGERLPWQVAAAHHPANRELVALLHPGRSVAAALGLNSSRASGTSPDRMGPASLATIAAAALQAKLMADLQRLEAAAAAAAPPVPAAERTDCPASAAAATATGTASMAASKATGGRRSIAARVTPGVVLPGEVQGSGASRSCVVPYMDLDDASEADEDGILCGVCFAAREAVAPAGCGHGLCGSCAAQLCRVGLAGSRPRPLLCPFCRQEVAAFEARTNL